MPLGRWSRRAMPVVWTTVTQYCTASLTSFYNDCCSLFRRPPRGWSLAQDDDDVNNITPVLRELHWLPVRRHVQFKIATLVFKALNNLAPPYLVDDCNLVSDDTRRLRSAASLVCCTEDKDTTQDTDHSQSPAHETGTVCRLYCGL